MKKGVLLSLVLTLFALLPAGVSAGEIAGPQIQCNDGVVSVINAGQAQKDRVLIGAQYDANGTMTKVKTYDAADSVSVMNEFDPSSSVRFMLWNSLSGMEAEAQYITVETEPGVVFKAVDFDYENSAYRNATYGEAGRFYVYTDGGTGISSYKLAVSDGAFTGRYYVNGVDLTGTGCSFDDFVDNYIVNNGVGSVTLLAESQESDVYDNVMVTYYEDAIVDSVEANGTDTEIYFYKCEGNIGDSLIVDYTDKDVDVSIVKGGKKINAADIKPYDVLSIAYDVTANFGESAFYDVIVSDNEPLTGKGAVRMRYGLEYQINGKYYPAVEELVSRNLDRYTTYIWYIDAFGRIAYVEEDVTDKNFAVIDNIYPSNDGEKIYVKLICKDGTTLNATLGAKLETEDVEKRIENYIFRHDVDENDSNITSAELRNHRDGKHEPHTRVVTYRVNSSNELTQIDYITDYRSTTAEYRESSNRIGQYPISEKTSVLTINNNGDTWDISAIDTSALKNGEEYTAYFYERSASGVYGLAIVLGVDVPEAPEPPESEEQTGIIDNIYTSDDGESMEVILIGSDGKSFTVSLGKKLDDPYTIQTIEELIFVDGNRFQGKNDPWDRVVRYKTNSVGELTAIEFFGNDYREVSGKYNSASGRIGEYALTGDISIMAANDNGGLWDIDAADASMLTDGEEYTAYFYGQPDSGNYSFAIVRGVDLPEPPENEPQFGVLNAVYMSNDGEAAYVSIITGENSYKAFALSSKLSDPKTVDEIKQHVFADDGWTRKAPQDRVVRYRTNSRNELSTIEFMTCSTAEGKYIADDKRIGNCRFSDNSEIVIIAQDGDDWSFSPASDDVLYDGDEYTAYFYDRAIDGTYNYVMIMDNYGGWSKHTAMAVYVNTVVTSDENYEYAIELYTSDDSDEITTLFLSDEYYEDSGEVREDFTISLSTLENNRLAEGTPVLYTTDASGAITSMRRVFSSTYDNFIGSTYDELVNVTYNASDLQNLIDVSFRSEDDVDPNDKYKLVFGLVSAKYDSGIDIVRKFISNCEIYTNDGTHTLIDRADVAADTIGVDTKSYELTDQTTVYVYDYNGQSRYGTLITEGGTANIRATSFNSRSWVDGTDNTIAGMDRVSKPRYAVARVLGNDIMEIMVFVPEK